MNLLTSLDESQIEENQVAVVVYFKAPVFKYMAVILPKDKFEKHGLSIKDATKRSVKERIVEAMRRAQS